MRIQAQRETFAWFLAAGADLQEYRTERHRQETELEGLTGGYAADEADHFARGGKPLINYKDWLKGRKVGDGEWADRQAPVSREIHTPDPTAWGAGEAPSW